MVNILHGRPTEPEAEIHDRVVQQRDIERPYQKRMEGDRGHALQSNQVTIVRVERFHERVRWTIEVPVLLVGGKRKKQEHHVA